MSAPPDWWPTSIEEWVGLLMDAIEPQEAVRLEIMARELARWPGSTNARQCLEDLLDRSSSTEIELQGFLAIRDDERARMAGGAA